MNFFICIWIKSLKLYEYILRFLRLWKLEWFYNGVLNWLFCKFKIFIFFGLYWFEFLFIILEKVIISKVGEGNIRYFWCFIFFIRGEELLIIIKYYYGIFYYYEYINIYFLIYVLLEIKY